VLAGRGSDRLPLGAAEGVTVTGAVPDAAEVMAGAALLGFPCPPSSGPKLKVLDAVLHGLPVLTTSHGVEGLQCPGVTVADSDREFVAAAAELLADPQRRADRAAAARAVALQAHAPERVLPAWLGLAVRSADPAG